VTNQPLGGYCLSAGSTVKDAEFEWTEAHEGALLKLKKLLKVACLYVIDWSREIFLVTDLSITVITIAEIFVSLFFTLMVRASFTTCFARVVHVEFIKHGSCSVIIIAVASCEPMKACST
jgi:hypothetical protein